MFQQNRSITLSPLMPLLALLSLCAAGQSFAQGASYSTTQTYRTALAEITRKDAHPSLLGQRAGSIPDISPKVKDGQLTVHVQAPGWTLSIAKQPFALSFQNALSGDEWQIAPGGLSWAGADGKSSSTIESVAAVHHKQGKGWSLDLKLQGATENAELRILDAPDHTAHIQLQSPGALQNSHLVWNWQAKGPFFGLGERFAEEKLDGIQTTLRPEDLFGSKGHNWTYINVPLLYTPHGTGLYFDTGEVTQFDLTAAASGRFSVKMDRASTELFLLAGAGPKEALRAYTALTGTTPLSPPWAFGVWVCAYEGPDLVLNAAKRLRSEHIPASAIWTFDAMGEGDVMGWPLWRTGYYPKVREMTDKLHQMGFKSLTYVHPYLRNTLAPYNLANPQYEMAKANHFMVTDPKGAPTGPRFEPTSDGNIDFTNPLAVDWYQKKIRHILLEDGFDGWMEDYGEWINPDDQFANGLTGRDMQNLNSLIYHKATYEISKDAKPDVVEFSRSGYAGSQAYTRVVWGGDQFPEWAHDTGLPSVIAAGITAGLSGFAVWGPDIEENGYSKELWMRWIEFGALTPIMRDHPWDKPSAAINIWSDTETLAAFKKYAGLHVSLFPYLYTFAHEAQRTGLPIMRHPVLEVPHDAAAANADLEYFLGDKILVAPVAVQGATKRELYLPEGDWVDYWTGDLLQGGKNVTVDAPVDRIPMLVRAGSVLPFISPETQTLATDLPHAVQSSDTADRIWRIFPSGASGASHGNFTTYDGAVATVDQDARRLRASVAHAASGQTQELTMMLPNKPTSVLIGSSVSTERAPDLAKPNSGSWYYNAATHTLHVLPSGSEIDVTVVR